MDANPMSLETDAHNGRIVLSGEVDLANVEQLRAALEAVDGGTPLVLDVAGVTFMDSAGLRELLDAWRRLGSVTLLDPPPNLERLLQVTQADSVLSVVRSS
ncbi:MAG: STAS domain-containing protein [Microthrixaceae bacterium]